jgi:hypothetical protein
MIRVALALLVICIAAVALCAQTVPTSTQEAERARQLLQSSQWVDKAWGAYLAGRLHSADLDELLVEEFRTAAVLRSSPYWSEEHAYVYVLFDAAIEAGIAVPAELLDPFKEDWTDAVMILLARGEDSQDLLLALSSDTSRDVVWLAANNLLYSMRSSRWFAATLSALSITHRFTVTDQAYGPGSGGGTGGGFCGDGGAAMPKGFPPVTIYALEDYAQRGDVMLAHGPQNSYYKRTVVPTDKQTGIGSCGGSVDRASIRIGYLAEMANLKRDQAEQLFHAGTQILYHGIEDFQRQTGQSMEAQRQSIVQLLQSAKERGFSAPDVRLRIVPEVDDQRKDATEALPPVAEREIAFN